MMNRFTKQAIAVAAMGAIALSTSVATPALADNCCPPETNGISGKSVLAGVTSLLIWPGIGQAINDNRGKKVGTHALLGLIPPYRIWSGYDALVRREGGYWNGKI